MNRTRRMPHRGRKVSSRCAVQPPRPVLAGGLTAMLVWEDEAEDSGRLAVTCRLTCRVHRRWLHECIASPSHISGVAGHRWCRRHGCATSVVVDELALAVTMACPRCGSTRLNDENQAMLAACRQSIRASHPGHQMNLAWRKRAA